jgi:hypothetical protein
MGYFSSGTEGADYQYKYCRQCIHDVDEDCPIWLLHLNFVSASNKNELLRDILNELIPMTDNGVWNEQCKMYVEKYELAK